MVITLHIHNVKWYTINDCCRAFFVLLHTVIKTCILSVVWDIPLDNFWAFPVPRWFVDAERRFPMTEASENSISSGLGDEAAGRGDRETSRTLTADRRRAGTIFCPLFEVCVGTSITLPGYDMWECRKHTQQGLRNTYITCSPAGRR